MLLTQFWHLYKNIPTSFYQILPEKNVYAGQDAVSALKDKTITLIDLDLYTAWKQLSGHSVTRGINRTCRNNLTKTPAEKESTVILYSKLK